MAILLIDTWSDCLSSAPTDVLRAVISFCLFILFLSFQAAVLAELQRIEAGNGIDEELLNVIELVSVILGGLKGEEQNE